MRNTMFIISALLATSSTIALADQPGDTTRDERMQSALQDYRAGSSGNDAATSGSADARSDCNEYSNGGTFARAEAAMKRGACKTGHAVERGVKKTGHAIGNAGRKTGDAIRRVGEKAGGSPDKASSDPQAK